MSELNVTSLFHRYLERQTQAVRAGLALPDLGDALPHDLTPVQPIDAQLAWNDAQLAATALGLPTAGRPPAEWALLVNSMEPALVVLCALGNYPQQVRHVQALLAGAALTMPSPLQASDQPELLAWAERAEGDGARLLAAGVLRLAGQQAPAAALLARPVAAPWETVRSNERAALAWYQGDQEQALALWQALPRSAPVAFNLGLASLVRGQHERARTHLKQASTWLPESNAWHHLAELYSILASQNANE